MESLSDDLLSFLSNLGSVSSEDGGEGGQDQEGTPAPSPAPAHLRGALLGDLEHRDQLGDRLAAAMQRNSMEPARIDYIVSILGNMNRILDVAGAAPVQRGAAHDDGSSARGGGASEPTEKEMRQLTAEVRAMLPDLGEGFVEVCLAFHDFSVETVVNKILEDDLPPQLADMDRTTKRFRVNMVSFVAATIITTPPSPPHHPATTRVSGQGRARQFYW